MHEGLSAARPREAKENNRRVNEAIDFQIIIRNQSSHRREMFGREKLGRPAFHFKINVSTNAQCELPKENDSRRVELEPPLRCKQHFLGMRPKTKGELKQLFKADSRPFSYLPGTECVDCPLLCTDEKKFRQRNLCASIAKQEQYSSMTNIRIEHGSSAFFSRAAPSRIFALRLTLPSDP